MTKTNQNRIRTEIQSKAIDLSKHHKDLVLEWSTGCGKTLAAVKIAQGLINFNHKAVGYLVCKESTHLKNWKNDIKKHRKLKILNNISTLLYASLHKPTKVADFIILDECHALTDKRISNIKNIIGKHTRLIFLSATITNEKKYLISKIAPNAHYYSIPLIKAISLGLLPEPKLVVHRIQLAESKHVDSWDFVFRKAKNGFRTLKCKHSELFKVLKNVHKNTGITLQGSEKEYYTAITKQMSYYYELTQDYNIPAKVRTGCRNKYLNLGVQRKKFLSEIKTSHVGKLVTEFRNSNTRMICFTGSLKQVRILGGSSAVHSKNKKDVNQDLIDCFNAEECDELFAVKMLREGINLTNIEKGIITQLDSGIGSFFQMLGRCLRHEFPEMHLVVVMGTKDQEYFKNAMINFDRKFVELR
jgi:superfamily II DNA or RNA helicase